MSKNNPFANFDFSEFMKQIQDNPMMKAWQDSEIYKTMTSMDMKDFDFESLWNAQKKNLDHLTALNNQLGENVKELAQKQASMMGEAWETVTDYAKNATADADVEAHMQKAQGIFEKAMGNVQELSQRGMEMSEDTAKSLQSRMSESINDLQELAEKYRK